MPSNQELKSLWLGPSGTLGAAGESTLFYPGELGKTQWHKDPNVSDKPIKLQKVFRYATDGATAVNGGVAYWVDRDNYVVSGDPEDAIGGSANPWPAGVFLGAGPTAGNYGVIQVAGPVAELTLASGTNAAGDVLVNAATDATTGGIVAVKATNAGDEIHNIAVAVGAGDTTTGPAGDLVLLLSD
jgi:hypothetical protein